MRRIFLFTNNFPYSHEECFLEDEIVFLCNHFEKVFVIPFYKRTETHRPVPNNCVICEAMDFTKNRQTYIIRGLFDFRTILPLVKEFFTEKVFLSITRFKAWCVAYRYINNCLHYTPVKNVVRQMTKEDVAFFYWGTGQNLMSLYLKDKVHLVSRFHGDWDLWEEKYGGFMPLRKTVAKHLDIAAFISDVGKTYFKQKYPYANAICIPLGSKDYGIGVPSPNDNILRVLSCSTVYPLKRVPLIFETLNAYTTKKIEWTHFGAGSHFEALKNQVEAERKNHLVVNLMGNVPHDEVMDYYKKHHFDVFINVSTSEGVPVSIMEAMSFGIPIVATNVGATSEEVTEDVGVLLSPDPTIEELQDAIKKVAEGRYTPRKRWEERYNANENYTKFCKLLKNL